jgi:hypothetical protein
VPSSPSNPKMPCCTGFKLEKCLLDPSVDMVEVAEADVVDATDTYASLVAQTLDAADAGDDDAATDSGSAGTVAESSGPSGKRKRSSPPAPPSTDLGRRPEGSSASCATRDSFALDAVTCHDLELFATSAGPRQAGMSVLNAAVGVTKKGTSSSSSSSSSSGDGGGSSGVGRAYPQSSSSSSSSGVGWGSLLWHLDRTHSAAGRRVLQRWIQQPLATAAGIRTRQKSVEVNVCICTFRSIVI